MAEKVDRTTGAVILTQDGAVQQLTRQVSRLEQRLGMMEQLVKALVTRLSDEELEAIQAAMVSQV